MTDYTFQRMSIEDVVESLQTMPFMIKLFNNKNNFIYPDECNILNEIVKIPINLNIIRTSKNYKNIILKICHSEVISYYIKYSNFDNETYFHNIIKYTIYKNALIQILKILWCPYMFSKIQRKFIIYNYKPGNLGYLRINKYKKISNNIYFIYNNLKKYFNFCYYCKNYNYHDINYDDEWSD